MNFFQFNAQFRPLVDKAWAAHCAATGHDPKSKSGKDCWYREQLSAATEGRIHSTKTATEEDYAILLHRFGLLVPKLPCAIRGWSDAQNQRMHELAAKAWSRVPADPGETFVSWLKMMILDSGVHEVLPGDLLRAPGLYSGKREGFDQVMAALAVVADDQYWLDRTAAAAEIRMRWQIRQFMIDLEWLTERTVTWEYVRSIYAQADLSPTIDDAPAKTLRKVLAMLDSYIRKLCAQRDLKPMYLPSRGGYHAHRPGQKMEKAS